MSTKFISYLLFLLAMLLLTVGRAVAQSDVSDSAYSDSLVVAQTKRYKTKDLYSLRPTYQMELDSFFKNNQRLLECNEQLVKQLRKVKVLREYKYFETKGGFGIISSMKEVRSGDSNPSSVRRSWWQRLWGTGDSQSMLKRTYIFLVITSSLNEALLPNFSYLEKTYKSRPLERKWANIASLDSLLSKPNSTFDSRKHSFVVRVYDFKKSQLERDWQFVSGDATYVLDQKVAELFRGSL